MWVEVLGWWFFLVHIHVFWFKSKNCVCVCCGGIFLYHVNVLVFVCRNVSSKIFANPSVCSCFHFLSSFIYLLKAFRRYQFLLTFIIVSIFLSGNLYSSLFFPHNFIHTPPLRQKEKFLSLWYDIGFFFVLNISECDTVISIQHW